MKYNEYKKGYSALRRIINDEELEFSRQFVKFDFSFSERYQNSRAIRGIWNARTNNVVAFINKKGNVFVRPASVYTEHLLGSKNKVIKHNNLRGLRNKVSGQLRKYGMLNLYAEKATDRLIANGDRPDKVHLLEFTSGQDIDERFIMHRIKDLLKGKELPNTLFALEEKSLKVEQVPEQDSYRIHLDIEDYSEAIERKERLDRIKTDIARTFISNIRDIAQHAIITNHTMNPLQFTYNVDGEDTVTGRIALNRLDMAYNADIPITDWLYIETVKRLISFEERVGSLAERGIDEMSMRQECNTQQEAMYHYVHANSEWSVSTMWGVPTVDLTRQQLEDMDSLTPLATTE